MTDYPTALEAATRLANLHSCVYVVVAYTDGSKYASAPYGRGNSSDAASWAGYLGSRWGEASPQMRELAYAYPDGRVLERH